MLNKTILFRADSSSTIGTGHIMRDLVLAQQYAKKGDHIIFATQNLKGHINHKILEARYKIELLKSNDIKELDKLIKKLNIDMIVIDHYGIDYKFEKKLKIKNPTLKILSFDDTYEKHYCDILLNHNISADKKKYKNLAPPFCELRCGSKYTLIRDEFKKEREMQRDKVYDVLVAMGGTDASNINIKILKTLTDTLHVGVLTTSANANLKELQNFILDKKNISLHVDSNEVAKLINQSKFAIITPSVIVHEILFMDIPFLAIKTALNQDDMYKYLTLSKYKTMEKFDENSNPDIF